MALSTRQLIAKELTLIKDHVGLLIQYVRDDDDLLAYAGGLVFLRSCIGELVINLQKRNKKSYDTYRNMGWQTTRRFPKLVDK
jgi:hypothetical protein